MLCHNTSYSGAFKRRRILHKGRKYFIECNDSIKNSIFLISNEGETFILSITGLKNYWGKTLKK